MSDWFATLYKKVDQVGGGQLAQQGDQEVTVPNNV